jgi:ferrous-iron efflux pump FieF
MKQYIQSLSTITISRVTVGAVIILLLIKLLAYVLSASTAVLSSLMDSIIDSGLSLMTLLALTWSSRPKDDDHRHGHQKIEGVSALLQAAFMMGAASFLVLESIQRILNPVPIDHHLMTSFCILAAIIISALISYIQHISLQSSHSVALKADHSHYSTDIYLNGAVLLVIVLDGFHLAPFWLDPVSGVAVAILFARTAYKTASEAIDHLMDREVTGDIRSTIIDVINRHKTILSYHDLRITGTITKLFVTLDIEVSRDLSLLEAHDIARLLEHDIIEIYPNAEILIHIDPEGDIHDTRH